MRGFRNGTKLVDGEIRPAVSVAQVDATSAPRCWTSPKVVGYRSRLRTREGIPEEIVSCIFEPFFPQSGPAREADSGWHKSTVSYRA